MKHGTATPTPAYGAQRIEQRRLHKLETPVDLTLLEIDTIEAVASHEVIYQLAAILPSTRRELRADARTTRRGCTCCTRR